MLLLDEFWSHSWFNWLKLAKKNLNAFIFPFCHLPQHGQFCPTIDMSLAVAAGSMSWQGTWGPAWPCGRQGHGHGAHPGSPCLPPLLLKAAQTRAHRAVMGQLWVTQARVLASGTTSHPIKLLCAVISLSIVSWSFDRVFDQKLTSGSKMLWIHTLLSFYSDNLVNHFASSS